MKSSWNRVSPNFSEESSEETEKEGTEKYRGEGHVKTEAETEVMHLQAKEL